LDLAVDRYRFQFEIIASYLTGFLITGIGFGPIVAKPASSGCAGFGGCGRRAAAVVAAATNAIATNAVIVRRYVMEISLPPAPFSEGQPGQPLAQCFGAVE
jgi:hypothetical protein